jgi:signal transduction histidine kinase
MKGEKLPGIGYATYRLHVITDFPTDTQMGLLLNNFSSAYNLYVNDKLIATSGIPSVEPEGEVGKYKVNAIYFQIPMKEFDILIQVSNYETARGGFWNSAYLGTSEGIGSLYSYRIAQEMFLIGALAIICIYSFYLYIARPELKFFLYFSILCAVLIIALDMIEQLFIISRIPWLDFRTTHAIWYTSTAWIIILLLLFVHELFPSKLSRIIVRISMINITIWQIVLLLTKPVFYTRFVNIYNILAIIGALGAVMIVAVGIRYGYKDGWINIISMITVLVVYLHDILYRNNIIRSRYGEIINIGIFLFIIIHLMIQTKRVKGFYNKVTASELATLQAQIKPHFIYNSLNTFISISYYDIEKARELLVHFADYLRRSFDFKNPDQFTVLKNELELTRAYIEIEKVRFEERLEILLEVPEATEIKVPILILQPIIENAIIHGVLPKPEGGRIEIVIKNENNQLMFKVIDNGIGMDLHKQKELAHNKGNRVGIANIDNRLKKLYGKGLQIKSVPGEGTEVTWIIPINRKGKRKAMKSI